MTKLLSYFFIILAFSSHACNAEEVETEVYSQLTPSQKKVATDLFNQVKCPTCNGQYIKESNTPSAKILRDEIAGQIVSGKNADEIRKNLINQFGEDIISSDASITSEWLLWACPLAFLLFAASYMRQHLRF